MNLNWLRIAGFTGCAALTLLALPRLHAAAPGALQQGYYGQDRDWDRPRDEWNDIQRRGFRDGIEGARRDVENHRQPDVNRRKEYREADDVPPQMREAYREAFRRGYDVGISHYMGAPGGQMYSGRPPEAAPEWFNDAQRRGFQAGMAGAQDDYQDRRQLDVNNRREYQRPDMPPELWGAYREGFRRGYQVSASHLMGTPLPAAMPWDYVPPEYSEFQRRGFQDGLTGAQKDYGHHRQPNVNDRKEYRDPDNIPHDMREAYREGFRRGYDVGWDHIMGRDHDRY